MTSYTPVTIWDGTLSLSLTSITSDYNMTESTNHCHDGDLTTAYGLIIQGVLAFLAFNFLILKRLKEPVGERRPWLIWFFDTSKQALGALFIHFANVFLSSYVITQTNSDPCSWYIVYFLLDSTVGLLCIYIAVRVSSDIIAYLNCITLRFGEYGHPPRWDAWVGQCAIYLLITLVEKAVVTGLASLKICNDLAKILMTPIRNRYVEVALVMLIIPFIVNAIMFWVVDNFLMMKRKKKKKNPDINMEVRFHKNKQNENDGLNQSELEILVNMDEEEIKMRNGNHFAERI